MKATEIVTTFGGYRDGKEVHCPTGEEGRILENVYDWVRERKQARIDVKDVSATIIVANVDNWMAFEEKVGKDTLKTIFKIEQ